VLNPLLLTVTVFFENIQKAHISLLLRCLQGILHDEALGRWCDPDVKTSKQLQLATDYCDATLTTYPLCFVL
jgi:hypothetical protein